MVDDKVALGRAGFRPTAETTSVAVTLADCLTRLVPRGTAAHDLVGTPGPMVGAGVTGTRRCIRGPRPTEAKSPASLDVGITRPPGGHLDKRGVSGSAGSKSNFGLAAYGRPDGCLTVDPAVPASDSSESFPVRITSRQEQSATPAFAGDTDRHATPYADTVGFGRVVAARKDSTAQETPAVTLGRSSARTFYREPFGTIQRELYHSKAGRACMERHARSPRRVPCAPTSAAAHR